MSKNVEIVQSFFNAVAKGDFDTVGNLFTDEYGISQKMEFNLELIYEKHNCLPTWETS